VELATLRGIVERVEYPGLKLDHLHVGVKMRREDTMAEAFLSLRDRRLFPREPLRVHIAFEGSAKTPEWAGVFVGTIVRTERYELS
jgi:hypothetical protein